MTNKSELWEMLDKDWDVTKVPTDIPTEWILEWLMQSGLRLDIILFKIQQLVQKEAQAYAEFFFQRAYLAANANLYERTNATDKISREEYSDFSWKAYQKKKLKNE